MSALSPYDQWRLRECPVCNATFDRTMGTEGICPSCWRGVEHVVALGTAIAAFVRRARVAELVETVESEHAEAVSEAEWLMAEMQSSYEQAQHVRERREAERRMSAALTELAAMARGER